MVRFHCPKGHAIAAAASQVGRQGRCPKCGAAVMVPRPRTKAPVTDDAALALLGEYVPSKKRRGQAPPVDMRNCPRCDALVPVTSRICDHCHVYLD